MRRVLVLFAHPVFERSRVNKRLVGALRDLPGVTIHDLYEAYPTLGIDVRCEQALLGEHDVIVFQHLMYLVDLSAALGTFLAGVVLADSEYRHELETDLEPFKGLLLGLFFISIGAQIDFGLIGREPLRIGAIVLATMAGKLIVLYGLGPPLARRTRSSTARRRS